MRMRMRMRDGAAECSPEPFDAIGFGIIGGGVDQHQLATQFLQQCSHQERARGGVAAQVVQQHQRDPSTCLGTLDRAAQLSTQRWGRSSSHNCRRADEYALSSLATRARSQVSQGGK